MNLRPFLADIAEHHFGIYFAFGRPCLPSITQCSCARVLLRPVGRRAGQAFMTDPDLFERAFSNAPIGMALVDMTGQVVHVNAMLCRITGYTAEELRARPFSPLVDTDAAGEACQLDDLVSRTDPRVPPGAGVSARRRASPVDVGERLVGPRRRGQPSSFHCTNSGHLGAQGTRGAPGVSRRPRRLDGTAQRETF